MTVLNFTCCMLSFLLGCMAFLRLLRANHPLRRITSWSATVLQICNVEHACHQQNAFIILYIFLLQMWSGHASLVLVDAMRTARQSCSGCKINLHQRLSQRKKVYCTWFMVSSSMPVCKSFPMSLLSQSLKDAGLVEAQLWSRRDKKKWLCCGFLEQAPVAGCIFPEQSDIISATAGGGLHWISRDCTSSLRVFDMFNVLVMLVL